MEKTQKIKSQYADVIKYLNVKKCVEKGPPTLLVGM